LKNISCGRHTSSKYNIFAHLALHTGKRTVELKNIILYNNRTLRALLVIFTLTGVFYACSVKKNKWINRAYHGTTSRFNGYFNGGESFKEGVANLEKAHIDKYDRLLPVFKFGTVEQSKSIYPQMDKAIKKAETVVTKHSMLIKGKQYNAWVDACYLLRGKARFYKRDYYAALEDLEYVANTKSKKKRRHWRHEAMIYLARTYSELAMFSEAQSVIDRIKNEAEFPNKMKDQFYAVQADFHLKQGDDSAAIAPLRKAIELTKSKKVRARYTYILAQIHQKNKNYKEASKMFGEVLKMQPSYDMAFNAQLNLARSFDSSSGTSKGIRQRLLKMAKEDKNIDYLDQIYYALGELAQRDNDETQALKDYNKSVRFSKGNNTQKGTSYLAIGEIYLSHPEYRPAKAYYDSSSVLIDRESPLYKGVQDKKKSLSELIRNLDVIEVEDSLQTLAKMPEAERLKKINAFLDEKDRLEREAKANNTQGGGNDPFNNNNVFNNNNNNNNTSTPQGQGFYFTNQILRSQGFGEFKRIWGDRTLADNWRRSNKQSILPTNATNEPDPLDSLLKAAGGDTLAMQKLKREADVKKIIDVLPLTQADFDSSDNKILDAYYNAANIYREQLDDKLRAVEMFEKMLLRFPSNNKYELSTYYQLYRVYGVLGNTAKADYYKNKILKDFPTSDYAKLINNPGTPLTDEIAKKELEKFYSETFDLYKKQFYREVVTRCDEALAKYKDKEFRPKFAYLRALAVGRTQDVNSFEASLRDVVTNYPLDPVKGDAQYLLDYIKKSRGDSAGFIDNSKTNVDALTMFTMAPDSIHNFALILTNKKVKVNEVKTLVSDFNTEFFSLMDLKIESRFLNDSTQMILVRKFNNQPYATTYFNAIKGDKKALALLGANDYVAVIVTNDNLAVIQKQKTIDNYKVFFKDKYKLN
jgi:tetratricopeptide (TPR) repeat protein